MTINDIKALQERVHDLIGAFQSSLSEFEALDKMKAIIEEQEKANRRFEKELEEREKQLYIDRDTLDNEKAFINKSNRLLAEKELELSEKKQYVQEIEKAKAEWEDKKNEAMQKEIIVDRKLKELEGLNARKEELDKQEALIIKSNAIDADRKRLADIREERIRAREIRMGIEQNE